MKNDNQSIEYTANGGWGDDIVWLHPEEFDKPFNATSRFSVSGHQRRIPKVGDTLKSEFIKSWMWFEFKEVRQCRDPQDMFFATVQPIKQEMK